MPSDYPYMISNNKIKPILDAILLAAKPPRFSNEFLKKLGFNSSNDRAVIPLLRGLGFINENGAPTEFYDDLKDKTKRDFILGERIKDLYKELYTLNPDIHASSEDDIKGAISRITGKDAKSVNRYYTTLKSLTALANFELIKKDQTVKETKTTNTEEKVLAKPIQSQTDANNRKTEFHYNIQIHLPSTTEISVYNAIFKSLKETLLG